MKIKFICPRIMWKTAEAVEEKHGKYRITTLHNQFICVDQHAMLLRLGFTEFQFLTRCGQVISIVLISPSLPIDEEKIGVLASFRYLRSLAFSFRHEFPDYIGKLKHRGKGIYLHPRFFRNKRIIEELLLSGHKNKWSIASKPEICNFYEAKYLFVYRFNPGVQSFFSLNPNGPLIKEFREFFKKWGNYLFYNFMHNPNVPILKEFELFVNHPDKEYRTAARSHRNYLGPHRIQRKTKKKR